MRTLKYILLGFVLLFSIQSIGQNSAYTEKVREVSLNMSGLVSQLVPFSPSGLNTGPFDVTWLSGRNNTFFRMSLGASLGSQPMTFFGGSNDFGHIAIGIGFTKRRKVYKNWIYESSVLGMAYGGGLNAPNANDPNGFGLGVGIGFAPGYEISNRVRINAEAILFLGLGTNTIQVIFVPPIAINLKYRFESSIYR